jgi:hypothetical protein
LAASRSYLLRTAAFGFESHQVSSLEAHVGSTELG